MTIEAIIMREHDYSEICTSCGKTYGEHCGFQCPELNARFDDEGMRIRSNSLFTTSPPTAAESNRVATQTEGEKRKYGKFTISHYCIDEHPDEIKSVLAGCIVLKAQSDFRLGVIEYEAIHDDFKPVEPGCELPTYVAKMFRLESGRHIMMGWEEFKPFIA